MITCPHCNVEMSKKWQVSNVRARGGSAVVWACGVCGCHYTKAEIKLLVKQSAEPLSSA